MDYRVEEKPNGTVFYIPLSVEAFNKLAAELYERTLQECQEKPPEINEKN